MSPTVPPLSTAEQSRVFDLAVEYHAAVAEGRTPDLGEVCRDHPHLLPRVREVLQAGEQVAAVAHPGVPLAPAGPVVLPPRYVLEGKVGEGGMGVVYAGRDVQLDRDIAVKLLRPDRPADPSAVRRFVAEAKVTAQLQHPGVPAVHELGTLADGRPFLAMKLIRGQTLATLLKTTGHGSARWLGVFESVCQAVGAAHAAGVIHRDLKPGNVMVGAFGEVQVMDWGLAKKLGIEVIGRAERGEPPGEEVTRRLTPLRSPPAPEDTPPVPDTDRPIALTPPAGGTRAGTVLGTPGYMAPEQARGAVDLLDHRTDVFALGCILCELLTSQPPLTGKPHAIAAAAAGDFAAAHARLDGCGEDPALVALCKRCLSVDPAGRPADASTVAAAVASFRGESEARAKRAEVERAEAAVQVAEQRKRRRTQAVLGGVAGGFLLAAVVGTTIGLVLAEQRRGEADHARGQEKERADEAVQAQRDEAVARANEERASAELLAALDAIVSEAAGKSLATQKAITPEQKNLFTRVLPLYREFASRRAGDDETSRLRIARAAHQLGMIESRLGRMTEGAAALGDAEERYAALAAEFPAVPDYQRLLLRTHSNLGTVLFHLGHGGPSEEQFRKALALAGKLATEFPAEAEYQESAIAAHTNLGALLSRLGRWDEAEREHRVVSELADRLAKEVAVGPEYRKVLALNHVNLASLLTTLGRWDEAEQQYRAGLAVAEKLAAEFPAEPQYQFLLTRTHANLGFLLNDLRRGAKAEEQYRTALNLAEKLARGFPAVPEYRDTLADNHLLLGKLLAGRGEHLKAEEQYRKALALAEALAAEFPTVPNYRQTLIDSHVNLANGLARLGQVDKVAGQYRKALAVAQKVVEEFPAIPEYRNNLSLVHVNLGDHLADRGEYPKGEEQIRIGLDLVEKLVEEFPTIPLYRKRLANAHTYLGWVLAQPGVARDKEAEEEFLTALGLAEKLAEEFPDVLEYQLSFGGNCSNYGYMTTTAGRPQDSLPWLDKAIRTLTVVHHDQPQYASATEALAGSHGNRAVAYDQLGKHADAVKDWDRVVELTPKQEQPRFRAYRANSKLNAGQVEEAVAEVAELRKTDVGWPPDYLYGFACVYSVASGKVAGEQQNYADRAMELLSRALKGGYKDVARLKADQDLVPLRERADFKKLLAELEAKFPPPKEVLPPPRADK